MKNAATQKSQLEETKEIEESHMLPVAKMQLDLLIRALKMIESEGVLNKSLIDEKDLIPIKEEIKLILNENRESQKLNSIWMNYSGASGVSGACKPSDFLNIGRKVF